MGTQGTTGAISTILDGELDLDHLILIPVQSWCPTDAGMTLWIGDRSTGRFDMRDQVRLVGIARLGDEGLVPHPGQVAFSTIARLRIVR